MGAQQLVKANYGTPRSDAMLRDLVFPSIPVYLGACPRVCVVRAWLFVRVRVYVSVKPSFTRTCIFLEVVTLQNYVFFRHIRLGTAVSWWETTLFYGSHLSRWDWFLLMREYVHHHFYSSFFVRRTCRDFLHD